VDVRTALTTIAWRAAVSAIAGLLVSAFAAAALTFGAGASAERIAVGRTISDALAPLLSAVAGAGLIATVVVFGCLVMNDVLRAVGRWLAAQRRWFVLLFRRITWLIAQIALAIVKGLHAVARSTVVAEAVWLVRTVGKAVGWGVICFAVLVGCAVPYFGAITLGLFAIGESTRIVVTMLDDPPRPLTMALGLGGAAVLMYVGIAAFALCAWVTYLAARTGARAAARRVGTVAS
jgi:hypothetical protein